MPYKIGLVATHGTGKTTTAHLVAGELKKRGLRVRVIPEVATEAVETGKVINQHTTLNDQGWILLKQALYEIEAELAGYDVIVCDRTVFDNYCYLANACSDNEHYLEFVLGHGKQHFYSAVYYVPVITKPEADGVRATAEEFQLMIDTRLRSFLGTNRIVHRKLPLPLDNDKERTAWVKLIVEETLQKVKPKSGEMQQKLSD